jgi:hypothetical protein
MCIRSLAVASLILLLVIASAGAEDIKIMGLTETHAARSASKRPLTYLTGSCQKKHRRMKCHLNEVAVNKVDPTPLEDKAKAVMEQVKQDPQSVETVIASQMPYLCHEPTNGKDRMEETAPSDTRSPEEQALRQATRHFCAEKSEEHLRTLFDLWGKMQARTCALWVNSYDKDFTLRGKEWVSTQGPAGPCGIIEAAVFSSPISNSQGQAIRFNRYHTRHIVTKKNAPLCTTAEDKEYVFALEKPRYAECVYIDFSPWTFGWSWWQPRAP